MSPAARTPGRRAGRPAGSPPNRQAILAAAQRLFVERGYDGATIRGIAAEAGVDPALVHHYFGTKERLLLATMQDMARLDDWLDRLAAGGLDGLGERVVRAALEAYEVVYRPMLAALLGLLRSSTEGAEVADALREGFGRGGLSQLAEAVGLSQPRLRAALVATEVMGLLLARNVVRLEPIASADVETLVAWYAPTIQRHLTAPLRGDDPAAAERDGATGGSPPRPTPR